MLHRHLECGSQKGTNLVRLTRFTFKSPCVVGGGEETQRRERLCWRFMYFLPLKWRTTDTLCSKTIQENMLIPFWPVVASVVVMRRLDEVLLESTTRLSAFY